MQEEVLAATLVLPQAPCEDANHVHARVVQNELEGRSLELMLIETYNPPLNAT